MRRRTYLAGVGASLAGAGVVGVDGTVGAARQTNGFTALASASGGAPPTEDGSIRVDVVGTSVTEDAEVRTCVDALDTALAGALRAEIESGTPAEIGIRGYDVHGWSSTESFETQAACAAIEDAAEKLDGTPIGDVATVVAWLWDYNASWSAGRGIGKPWVGDPTHQHTTFVDNVDNPSTRKLAYTTVHEVGHALLSTASGHANCDPVGYDTGPYEACAPARALAASWYRGHPDHTLGTAIDVDGTLYRTPMAHQGDAYLAGHCRFPQHGVPYNWTFHLSRCTIEALGHSWRHAAGVDGHGDPEHAPPDPVTDAQVTVPDDGEVVATWEPVSDVGDAGLEYYGLETREYDGTDARRLVPEATGMVPAGTTEATIGGLDPNRRYWIRITPVDAAGNRPGSQFVTTFETGDDVVEPDPGESPVAGPADPVADEPGGGLPNGDGAEEGSGDPPSDDVPSENSSRSTEGTDTEPDPPSEDDVESPDPNESDPAEETDLGTGDEGGDDSIPGFGVGAAVAGLTGAAVLRRRLREEDGT